MEQLLDRFTKAPPTLKYGGIVVLMALLTAANFFLFVQPALEQIESQQRTLADLERKLGEKQAIAQNLNERRKEMDVLEQQLAEALSELPEGKDIDELLAQFNDIGKKSGLEISKIEPGKESQENFYAKIPVKMAVVGNYHEIAMFLQEIANMRRIVNVNNVKLQSPEVKSEKVVLKSEFLATTFRFLDQSGKAGQNTKGAKGAGTKR